MTDPIQALNPAQKEAVIHKSGPLMIIAGAGTGKTTVITNRIAWLINEGHAKAEEILALTFTEKAAAEMEERVDQLLPMGYLELQVSTFHSFCEKLLRDHGIEIGLASNFRVLTEVDAWLLTLKNFDQFELEHYKPLGNPTRYIRGLLSHVSAVKDELVSPEDYRGFVENRKWKIENGVSEEEVEAEAKRMGELAHVYETYEQIMHKNDSMDFAGLILYTLKLLKERPNILEELRRRYTNILVDEFQDTNSAQYELVKLLSEPDNNVTVVGDDDQSIYKFRGASLSNILQFETDYPDTKKVVLTENYRSRQTILDSSYNFIQTNNPNRLETRTGLSKKLQANREGEGFVRHLHHASLTGEARAVTDEILKLKNDDPELKWSDISILVRANSNADPFIDELDRRKIPYYFMAMRGLYTKPVILDVLAWMRIIMQPRDSVSWYRVLSHPMHNIGTEDLQELMFEARKSGKHLGELADSEQIKEIQSIQKELSDLARKKRGTEMMIFLTRKTGLLEHLNALPEQEKIDTFRLLQQFYERMKRFESRNEERGLKHFLDEFEHERNAGETGSLDFDIETGPDTVKVMTVHASKGLEFRYVFVVNMVDRRFPTNSRADQIPVPEGLIDKTDEGSHLEEERRLFYVAMTRAKDGLFLTSAEDYGGVRKKRPSRFLLELGFEVNDVPGDNSNFLQNEVVDQKVHEGASTIVDIPKQFSFTQLQAYRTCPLQYKFAHILRIPVLGAYQMSFGKSVHNALEQYFSKWVKDGAQPELESLISSYNELWIDDWYPDDEVRATYKKQGRASLEAYHKELDSQPVKPLAVEQPFTLRVGDVIMKGRIDRIDETSDGLHIIDYKTGSPKTLKKLKRENKEQLYIYQMAVNELFDKPVTKLSYYYINDNSSVDFLGTETDLMKLRNNIGEFVAGLKEREFTATPGNHCQYCDFADICEFRK